MSFPAHLRATLALGLPLIGGHLAEFAIGLTDTVMLGWYGVEPLAAATLCQTAAMSLWLRAVEPGEITRVLSRWRRTIMVGITGALGSLGWFAAFSLQNAAYVRVLGQVEIVFTLIASALVFYERLRGREAAGVALVVLSVVVLVLAAA